MKTKNKILITLLVSISFLLILLIFITLLLCFYHFNYNKIIIDPNDCEALFHLTPEEFCNTKGKDTRVENRYTFARVNKKGYLILVLFWNPAVTICSMLVEHIGGNNVLRDLFGEFGMNNELIIQYWFQISVVVQMITSGILLGLSANKLNPLKSGKTVSKAPKKKKEDISL